MAIRYLPDRETVLAALIELGFVPSSPAADTGAGSIRTQIAMFQQAWQLDPSGDLDHVTVRLLVEVLEAHRIGRRHGAAAPSLVVRGGVTSASGDAAPGLAVQVIARGFRSETVLADGKTGDDGGYEIAYARDAAGNDTGVVVRLLDGQTVVAEAGPEFQPRPVWQQDFVVADRYLHGPTAWEQLTAQVTARIDKTPPAALTADDLTWLAAATGIARGELDYFAVAYRLAAQSQVPPALFYALFRQQALLGATATRLQGRFTIDLSTPLLPLYYDVVLLDPAQLRAAVAQEIAARVVPASLADQLDAILQLLARSRDAAQAYYQKDDPARIFNAAASDLQSGSALDLLAALQLDAGGDPARLADRVTAIQFSDGSKPPPGGLSLDLLLAADPTLLDDLRRLMQAAPAGKAATPPGTQPPPAPSGAPSTGAATTAASAGAPPAPASARTRAFAAELTRDPTGAGLSHAPAVLSLLDRDPAFDLATDHVDRRFADAAPGPRAELKALQRVFKLAPTAREASALWSAGLRSAAQITALGENRFVARAVAGGAFTPASAARVFRKAHDVHIATGLVAAELRSLGGGLAAALGGPHIAESLEAVANDNPNLKNLFHLVDLCQCKDCNSVTSPAAYLVDVLEFLKHRLVVDRTVPGSPPTPTARDVLFARRPDLGDLDLSCDNTNVPLPYIDVVCELLEDAVAPDPGFAFTGALAAGKAPPALVTALVAHGLAFTAASFVQGPDLAGALVVRDARACARLVPAGAPNTWTVRLLRQTFRSAAELAAAPEYQNDAAYVTLAAAKAGFGLPFDLPYQESRGYFGQFGIARSELMRALFDGAAPLARDVAADGLGLADAERALIVTPDPAGQHIYWNTPTSPAADTVKRVDVFLTRTGLDVAGLQELLAGGFVNPGGALFIQDTDVDTVTAVGDGGGLSTLRFLTCDTSKKQIAGLDDVALDRIHRFLRLARALGWTATALDRAVMAPRLGGGAVDDALLVALADLLALRARLVAIPLDDLIAAFGAIARDGAPSPYDRLFQNPSANGGVDPLLDPAVVATGSHTLGEVAGSLAIALNVKPADLAQLIAAAPGGDALSFEHLAWLAAQVRLSRALGRSIGELLLLQAMVGGDPYASPAALRRWVAESDRLRDAGVRPADLQFLLAFTAGDLASRTLKDDAVTALLTALQAQLQAGFDRTRSPFDARLTSEENRAGLRAVLSQIPGIGAPELTALDRIVDGSFPGSVAAWLTATLGGVIDTAPLAAAAATIAGDLGNPVQLEIDRNAFLALACAALSSYLYGQARDAAVTGAIATGLRLADPLAAVLVHAARLTIGSDTRALLDWLGVDALIDTAHSPSAPPSPPSIAPGDPALAGAYAAVRLARQIALLAGALGLTSDEVAWLLGNAAALGWLRLEQLPYAAAMPAIPLAAWDELVDALGLLRRYPPVVNPDDPDHPFTLRSVFELAIAGAPLDPALLDRAALVTGWDRAALSALSVRFALTAGDARHPAAWLRLEAAVIVLRRLGLDVAGGVALVKPQLTALDARALRQALKTRFADADWLDVLKTLIDPLRQRKRDALVAYLLATSPGLSSSDDLFDHFLIDVEMCACQSTSRIVSAHGTLQLFAQRCLLAIEPTAVADVAVDDGWNQWTWMANYRVWEANRKVFLYPEDWLVPTLRDDRSEPFVALEKALAQNALTDQSISDAAAQYLQALDDLAFLEVVAMYYEERIYTLHVFARTKGGDPPLYYYRQFIKERSFTPWQKVDLDISGDHLMAFVRNGRLHLAWPIFSEQPNQDQAIAIPVPPTTTPAPADKTQKAWKVQLAVSELANGRWLAKRTSKDALPWPDGVWYDRLPTRDKFRFLPTDLGGAGFSIGCAFIDDGVHSGGIAGSNSQVFLGSFTLTGCKGYPEPIAGGGRGLLYLPTFQNTRFQDLRFVEQPSPDFDALAIMTFLLRRFSTILRATPGRFKVTADQQMSTIDWLLFVLELWTRAQLQPAAATFASERVLAVPLGTFMPYFYDDGNRGYVAIPEYVSPPDPDHGGARDVRFTFSDALALVQEVLALITKYLALYRADPGQDLTALLAQLVKDPLYLEIRTTLVTWSKLTYQIEFASFYHPLICFLRQTLYRDGMAALMNRDTQLKVNTAFDFQVVYQPTSLVLTPYPIEDIDFTESGAYASYNWELFFHLPLEIAVRLSQDQQFEQAMTWFHYIFDPTDASPGSAPQKYWRTKPFFLRSDDEYVRERIDTILNGIASDPTGATISELKFAVAQWRAHPFQPFTIARSRTVAFQQTVLMKYLDNLIGWGDSLFTQGTMESVNQATQLYVLADKLLGPRPRIVPPIAPVPPETYRTLEARVDLFGNAMLDLESLIPDLGLLPHGGAELPPSPMTLHGLYFCLPPNPNLLAYWDTVADRLFKIRHCQDITGVERPLALFAPPIDPGALVAAAASGVSLADVIRGLGAPVPFYRFTAMSQKATELAQQVTSLGQAMLAALDKRDGEALVRLKAEQERSVLDAVLAMKQQQVSEATVQIDALQKSIDLTTAKSQYYHSRPFMNDAETLAQDLTTSALDSQSSAQSLNNAAAIARIIPTLAIGVAGFGGSPTFNASFGSENIAGGMAGFAQVRSGEAQSKQTSAGLAATLGSFRRRADDWAFQAQLADKELIQLGRQLDAARLRLAIAQADIAQQNVQIASAAATLAFLRQKFTSQELYEFLADQLRTVYFQAYQLALACAHKAERCFQHELGSSQTFIGYSYWDNLRKGLTAGERLTADLKRLETAYYDANRREYELTKHLSLAQLDPVALLALRTTGACTFSVPELAFDLDHPGHHFRRLKTVAVTVPCVAGPYATVSCKLSLVGNRYRRTTDPGTGYAEDPGNDLRFVYNVGAIQSIATSQAQGDSGLFELNFRDERYLPFEGQGAIGSWRLEMPQAFRQFDYGTITDVILQLRYTARDGGSQFRAAAETAITSAAGSLIDGAAPLYHGVNVRLEYPDAWFALKKTGAAQLTIGADQLPFFTRAHGPVTVQSSTWLARVTGDPGLQIAGAGVALSPDPRTGLARGSSTPIGLDTAFAIAADPSKLDELSLVVGYTLGS